MRTFTQVIASSVVFNATTPAISTSRVATTAQFGPGAAGGPTKIDFTRGFTLQCNFGGNGTPSSGSFGGLFNLLVSNVPEAPMFVTASSAIVSSTGSIMFNATYSNYEFIDFQFIPAVTSTTGIMSVILTSKQGGA